MSPVAGTHAVRPAGHDTPAATSTQDDPYVHDATLVPALFDWLCRRGDTALILAQRLAEWCGHAPALEEDIALTNTALDLIGQARMWLGLAGEVEGRGRSADGLAFLRDAIAFRNSLLVEIPSTDMAVTVVRQFLFDAFHYELLARLVESTSPRVAEIAAKALKEAAYHVERSTDLIIRLGDGSAESHQRIQAALDQVWPYAGDLFDADDVDGAIAAAGIAPSLDSLHPVWSERVAGVLQEATLETPGSDFAHTGSRVGRHTEHLGYILADMQFLQRAYPDASW